MLRIIARGLLLFAAVLLSLVVARAQPTRVEEQSGLFGYVLDPDGLPVSEGSVVLQAAARRLTGSIERTGRFRVVPEMPGPHQLFVRVPGLAPYRIDISVPASRTLLLPVIRLMPATYFRARFVSMSGEPITPRLRRVSFDSNDVAQFEPPELRVTEETDADGTITVGPMPFGVSAFAVDLLPLAQTRLADVLVSGADTLHDAGTVTILPGATLHVDVVDGDGAPVAQHQVSIEDARPRSPLAFQPVRTNDGGRATFERLGPGPYRLRASAVGRCGGQTLAVSRAVSVSGSGQLQTRLVVGGTVTFQLASPHGPLSGIAVSALPDNGPPSVNVAVIGGAVVRMPARAGRESSCGGTTDADGRVTLPNFPPGPARMSVRVGNSMVTQRVSVPSGMQPVAVVIPDGFMPVRVFNAARQQPLSGADITWIAGGALVETRTTGTGDALVEGISAEGGTLQVGASGFQSVEIKLPEPPATPFEVALTPEAQTVLRPRVITAAGTPIAKAIVELAPENPVEAGMIVTTDEKGLATFRAVPAGVVHVSASAEGLVTATARLSQENRSDLVLTLVQGYRVILDAELPAETGMHAIRVLNERGASMDGYLDARSDRAFQPPARPSLGPLPPGNYVIELHSALGTRQERIQVVDGDVSLVVR